MEVGKCFIFLSIVDDWTFGSIELLRMGLKNLLCDSSFLFSNHSVSGCYLADLHYEFIIIKDLMDK